MGGFVVGGVTLVDSEGIREGCLRVEGERIAEVLPGTTEPRAVEALARQHDCEVVDGEGLWLIPGGVDPHVHFAMPVAGTRTVDDFVSGSRAALAGGTTTVIDFVTPPRGGGLVEAAELRLAEARSSACDFGLHASVTGWHEGAERELARCAEDLGLCSVKIYLAYLETIGLQGDELVSALCAAERLGLTVLMHCEDGPRIDGLQGEVLAAGHSGPLGHALSRPPATEEKAVREALSLAREIGCLPYLVHLSTAGAVDAVLEARGVGQRVLAETCPQYLLLDDIVYERPFEGAAPFVMSPPLRPPEHGDALREALSEGHFDAVATDHCSFDLEQKALGREDFRLIPGGAAGVQHRLSLLFTMGVKAGRIGPSEWVRLVSGGPAEIFGLYPRKGSLKPGADADLVLWDPSAERVIRASEDHHRADNSIFEGMEVVGRPRRVWSRGELVAREGQVLVSSGRGRFLGR